MKRLISCLFLLCCLPNCLSAQIDFRKKEWNELLAEAKIQRKLIYVDAYADWCGPCKMLDRDVFSNKVVGQKFNTYFINAKANVDKDRAAIARQYGVQALPTGLFINGDGQLVYSFTGYRSYSDFMYEGEEAFKRSPDGVLMTLYTNAYKEGKRAPILIRSLLKLHRRYGKETEPILEEYLTTLPADSLNTTINQYIVYENVTRVDSRAFALLVANKDKPLFHDRARIILSDDVTRSAQRRDKKRLPILLSAVEQLETDGVAELKADYTTQFYQILNEWDQYAEQAETYAKTYLLPKLTAEAIARDSVSFWLNYNKLCSIGWHFVKEVKDEARLKTITEYVRQANQLIETSNATGACACLLYQTGQKEQAVQLQQKAVALAEKSGSVHTESYREQLKRMQKGKSLP